jgi:hypothetical protein
VKIESGKDRPAGAKPCGHTASIATRIWWTTESRTHCLGDGAPALQSRIHRLALEREYTEDALVHAPKGLVPDEPLHRLHAEGELPERE